MDTMLESTWDLLEQYERAGGALIFMEPVPFLSEGRPAGGSFRLLTDGRSVKSVEEALILLERLCPRRISVTGTDGKGVWGKPLRISPELCISFRRFVP